MNALQMQIIPSKRFEFPSSAASSSQGGEKYGIASQMRPNGFVINIHFIKEESMLITTLPNRNKVATLVRLLISLFKRSMLLDVLILFWCLTGRFCIDKDFRSKCATKLKNNSKQVGKKSNKVRIYPIALMLLFCRLYLVSKQRGLKYWLVSMEDNLCRLLSKYFINFTPLTESYIDYYGEVKPCLAKVSDIINMIKLNDPELGSFYQDINHVELHNKGTNYGNYQCTCSFNRN